MIAVLLLASGEHFTAVPALVVICRFLSPASGAVADLLYCFFCACLFAFRLLRSIRAWVSRGSLVTVFVFRLSCALLFVVNCCRALCSLARSCIAFEFCRFCSSG